MIRIQKTDSNNKNFQNLVALLDADLAQRDGEDHAFYDQFNKITALKQVVVAYENDVPVGCGAIKELELGSMEVKRMYVPPEHRNKGIATKILSDLEIWAHKLGYEKCVLETGKRQPEAISLYKKKGYRVIPNYGQYRGVENSVCFEKDLKTPSI